MKFEIPKDRTNSLKYIPILLIVLGVLLVFSYPLGAVNVDIGFYIIFLGLILLALSALSDFFSGKRREALGTFYGFAILFVFVLVILYIPRTTLPSGPCSMPAGMICASSYLSSQTDRLNITLVNGLQKTIIIIGMSCTKDSNQFEPCEPVRCRGKDKIGITVPLGSSANFYVSCNDESGNPMKFEQGDAFSGKINVEYYSEDGGLSNPRKLSGNIYVKAG